LKAGLETLGHARQGSLASTPPDHRRSARESARGRRAGGTRTLARQARESGRQGRRRARCLDRVSGAAGVPGRAAPIPSRGGAGVPEGARTGTAPR
jgi:hypothetical protein